MFRSSLSSSSNHSSSRAVVAVAAVDSKWLQFVFSFTFYTLDHCDSSFDHVSLSSELQFCESEILKSLIELIDKMDFLFFWIPFEFDLSLQTNSHYGTSSLNRRNRWTITKGTPSLEQTTQNSSQFIRTFYSDEDDAYGDVLESGLTHDHVECRVEKSIDSTFSITSNTHSEWTASWRTCAADRFRRASSRSFQSLPRNSTWYDENGSFEGCIDWICSIYFDDNFDRNYSLVAQEFYFWRG